jgi:outer membrane protein OmpA-like peptidoglycan-associated protein
MFRSIAARLAALTLLIGSTAAISLSQVDVPRRTTAVTYPLDEVVLLQFRGTTRFPRMKGEARNKRTSRNGTEVTVTVSKMPRPFELGAGYATYVLWAISPDGQVDNLGEIKRRGFFEFDSKIDVTTPLQTFALIITAEPHFLVRRPSQAIMLENLNPYTLDGRRVQTTPAVQYFGNSSDFFRDARTPEIAEIDYAKTPSIILQAKQAVALAKYAGAERDATTELREAEVLLQNAEAAWRAGRDEESVDITARQAVSAAVKAENTAAVRKEARARRDEQTRADAETREAEERVTNAENRISEIRAELAREMRNRELAERDAQNYLNQVRELQAENRRLSEELGRLKVEAETARTRLTEMERNTQQANEARDRAAREARIKAAEPAFIAALRRYGTVSRIDKSIVLVIPETLWRAPRSDAFAMQSDGKLTALAELLSNHPDYTIAIESHTDNSGDESTLQALTDTRARRVAEKFESLGIDEGRIRAKGFAGTIPAVPNTNNVNRAKNRRVNIILDLDAR